MLLKAFNSPGKLKDDSNFGCCHDPILVLKAARKKK